MPIADPRAFLSQVEPFRSLEPAILDDLAAIMTRHDLAAGEPLFREGDPGRGVFLVAAGELEVRRQADDGTDQLLRLMAAGEVGGLTSMASGRPRSATLVARTDSTVWMVPNESCHELLERHPALIHSLLVFLGDKVRQKTGQLATMLARQADDPRPQVAVFDTKPYDRRHLEPTAPDLGWRFFEPRLGPDTARLAVGFQTVCAFVNDDLSAGVLEQLAAGGVQLIALRCAGFNNVDLDAATRLDLTVVRVPAYSPHAVAEHAVALILTLNRKLHRAHQRVREGNFSLAGLEGFDLYGRTAGIVGLGKIGQCLAEILRGFGMTVLAFDTQPDRDFARRTGVQYLGLDEVLETADIVSLHAPLTPDTHHLIDAARLSRMKPGVMVINTSRGALVDTAALISGLKTGHVGAAGLDVYEEESDYFFEDRSDAVITDDVLARLLTFPNVLVTSHQAFLTAQALDGIARTTADNIRAFLDGRRGRELENVVLASPR